MIDTTKPIQMKRNDQWMDVTLAGFTRLAEKTTYFVEYRSSVTGELTWNYFFETSLRNKPEPAKWVPYTLETFPDLNKCEIIYPHGCRSRVAEINESGVFLGASSNRIKYQELLDSPKLIREPGKADHKCGVLVGGQE